MQNLGMYGFQDLREFRVLRAWEFRVFGFEGVEENRVFGCSGFGALGGCGGGGGGGGLAFQGGLRGLGV